MKTLKVFLSSARTIVPLPVPWVITSEFMAVRSGYLFWNWNNFPEDVEVLSGSAKIIFPKGYWTAEDIIGVLKVNGIGGKLNHKSLSATITPASGGNGIKVLKLGKLSEYLGFEKDTILNVKTTSPKMVDVNLGLRFVNISCNIVNREQTFFNGRPSRVAISVPVTSTQTLKGSVDKFESVRCLCNLDAGVYNELRFEVTSNLGDDINVGSIMLDLEIL